MTAPRVLVAGLGNVFLRDDGFGVEVAIRLRARTWPEGVQVVDFGLRGFDLAYALQRCDAAILVDAMTRGGAPGTLYVVEPELGGEPRAPETHAMTPDRVLSSLGAEAPNTVRLVGCEPATFEPEFDESGLSPPVQAAVDEAVRIVEALIPEMSAAGGADA